MKTANLFPVLAVLAATACRGSEAAPTPDNTEKADPAMSREARIERGKYLVAGSLCNDCHTPLTMGPNGPVRDWDRMLSGHPETLTLPPAPKLDMPWQVTAAATMTAWSGPWGITYTANLTPDPETGLGGWTEQNFIDTIRNGRHMGNGRPLLPPMPFDMIATYSDEDLAAIFAYLQSVPPVRNRVPAPVPAPAVM